MQPEDLLTQNFRISHALSAEQRRSLGTASQLLDVPLVRRAAEMSEQAFQKTVTERKTGIIEARRVALSLLGSGQYDIQALVVLVRSVYKLSEPGGFYLALTLIAKILGDAWEGLQGSTAEPTKSERAGADKNIRFIEGTFDQLYDALALWTESEDEVAYLEARSLTVDEGESVGSWSELLALLEDKLEARGLRRARWEALRERINIVLSASQPANSEAVDASEEIVHQEEDGVPSSMKIPGGAGESLESLAPTSGQEGKRSATLRVSAQFWELTERLRAFAWCLEQSDFEKAALIAADLEKRLQNFDAAGIFPGLFAQYFEGMADCADQLETGMTASDSVRHVSLTRLYETDLERFLQLGHSGDVESPPFSREA